MVAAVARIGPRRRRQRPASMRATTPAVAPNDAGRRDQPPLSLPPTTALVLTNGPSRRHQRPRPMRATAPLVGRESSFRPTRSRPAAPKASGLSNTFPFSSPAGPPPSDEESPPTNGESAAAGLHVVTRAAQGRRRRRASTALDAPKARFAPSKHAVPRETCAVLTGRRSRWSRARLVGPADGGPRRKGGGRPPAILTSRAHSVWCAPVSWGNSSAGRALRSQCRGPGFDPPLLHPKKHWKFR